MVDSSGWLRRAAVAVALLPLVARLHAQPLPGTAPLSRQGDLAMDMVASIDRYLLDRLGSSATRRPAPTAESRQRLRKLIGAVDQRVRFDSLTLDGTLAHSAVIGEADSFEALAVRWPAINGIEGEGLLLRPRNGAKAYVVAVPDADWTPEMLAGLAPGVPPEQQFARRLAESGCLVLVPYVLDRNDEFSGNPAVRYTNQPHREFVYRMAYEMGRHIIGYEVQKIHAAVDWFSKLDPKLPMGVIGYGEGGLLALFASALDTRIAATVVSGYFQKRESVVWTEPIYRNIWSQLETWGDAELAGLIAPRALIVEASPHPKVTGPPPERDGRRGAAPVGRIVTPDAAVVRAEFERASRFHPKAVLVEGGPGAADTLDGFLRSLNVTTGLGRAQNMRLHRRVEGRVERQFRQMVDHTQVLMRASELRRKEYFARLDRTNLETFAATVEPYRDSFWTEVQGKMPPASEALKAETRKSYDTPKFTGYDVVIPVWGDVYASGILLLPKDLKRGERRPVVVAQHGLEGRPEFLVDPKDPRNGQIYAKFAAAMAEQGFIVFAPQNPYIGLDVFRTLMRKGNPVKLSLFSFIIGQHARILDWLETQPFVDPKRMGFYGLSYGGKTAMRVPAVEKRYALSICSGDFNEWVSKVTSYDAPFSYMFTQEYDMLEFDLGNTFNYFEQAMLIAPRPFMVERGHRDGVGIDEWVSSEFAKVRRFYTQIGIGNRTEIEYFDGPHMIHGVGTYEFLKRHLGWRR
ncbi:MAG: hypothetical protein U0Q16_24080 [Bryobacteraceae bacterium]